MNMSTQLWKRSRTDVSHAVRSDILSGPKYRLILFTSAIWLSLSINKNTFLLTRTLINRLENSLAITVKSNAFPSQEAAVPCGGL